jgi:hypothetical protein
MRTLLLLLLLSASVFAQGTKSNPDPKLPDKKIDPEALLKEILSRAPTAVREVTGTLNIRDGNGKTHPPVPIKWTVRPRAEEWNDVYQTPRDSVIPPEDLMITHRDSSTNSYNYKRNGVLVPESKTNLFIPFGTSDFWVADLGLEFLHWPGAVHLKTEMRKSRACYVIETRNPKPWPGAYARVVSWVDTETGGLVRAEAYDQDEKLFKEFSVKSIGKNKEGHWEVKSVEIRNEKTDSRTILEFTLEISE